MHTVRANQAPIVPQVHTILCPESGNCYQYYDPKHPLYLRDVLTAKVDITLATMTTDGRSIPRKAHIVRLTVQNHPVESGVVFPPHYYQWTTSKGLTIPLLDLLTPKDLTRANGNFDIVVAVDGWPVSALQVIFQ